MDASFYPANVSMSVPSEPKEFVLYVKGLTVTAMARVSYCVDTMGKDFWVIVVDGGDRWYGRGQGDAFRHKRSLPPIN